MGVPSSSVNERARLGIAITKKEMLVHVRGSMRSQCVDGGAVKGKSSGPLSS